MDISIDSLSGLITWLTYYNVILLNKERGLKNVVFPVILSFCLVVDDGYSHIYMYNVVGFPVMLA